VLETAKATEPKLQNRPWHERRQTISSGTSRPKPTYTTLVPSEAQERDCTTPEKDPLQTWGSRFRPAIAQAISAQRSVIRAVRRRVAGRVGAFQSPTKAPYIGWPESHQVPLSGQSASSWPVGSTLPFCIAIDTAVRWRSKKSRRYCDQHEFRNSVSKPARNSRFAPESPTVRVRPSTLQESTACRSMTDRFRARL
jgi:hypothetical protein